MTYRSRLTSPRFPLLLRNAIISRQRRDVLHPSLSKRALPITQRSLPPCSIFDPIHQCFLLLSHLPGPLSQVPLPLLLLLFLFGFSLLLIPFFFTFRPNTRLIPSLH